MTITKSCEFHKTFPKMLRDKKSYGARDFEKREKSQMKQIFLFFVFLMLFVIRSNKALALTSGDFEYSVIGQEVHITKYNGNDNVVTVPSEIDGKNVVSVSFTGFTSLGEHEDGMNNYTVQKVILPSTVRNIEPYAFFAFARLREIDGLQYVHTVGMLAIGYLEKAEFSSNLTYLDECAILELGELTIPDDLPLTRLQTTDLKKISLIPGKKTKTLSLSEGVLFSDDRKTLIKYPDGKAGISYDVPDGTETIADYAFVCIGEKLLEITIPKSVTRIQNGAFDPTQAFALRVYRDSCGFRFAQDWNPNTQGSDFGYTIVGEEQSVIDRIDGIVASCKKGKTSDYDVALALHDWILDHVMYDYTMEHTDALSALWYGKTICNGYAELYRHFLNRAGIRNGISGNFDHAFNAVYLDNEWCYVDCTWDDQSDINWEDESTSISVRTFFGFDDTIRKDVYGFGESYHATSLKNHYFYRNHYADEGISYCKNEIQKQVDNGTKEFTISPAFCQYGLSYNIQNYIVAWGCDGLVWNVDGKKIILRAEYIPSDSTIKIYDESTAVRDSEYEFEIRNEGICLTHYLGTETDVIVPEEIGGIPVLYLEETFKDNQSINSVQLPSTLLEIGMGTFRQCHALKTVNFPQGLKAIGDDAFFYCSSLNSDIILPDSLQEIGVNAFEWCEKITKVVLPDGLQSIGDIAFGYCFLLADVKLPKDLTYIPYAMFAGCHALESLSLPQTLTSIGVRAFDNTGIREFRVPKSLQEITGDAFSDGKLEKITVDSGKPYFSVDSNNFVLYSADKTKLYFAANHANITEVTIPASVTEIAEYAFANNQHLEKVTIPESVTSIGEEAFAESNNLIVCCFKNSFAESWAKANEFKVVLLDESPGDINTDGVVDGRDVLRLMKYLAGEADPETGELIEINYNNADVDGSGSIDEKDLLRLVKFLAAEDVELDTAS